MSGQQNPGGSRRFRVRPTWGGSVGLLGVAAIARAAASTTTGTPAAPHQGDRPQRRRRDGHGDVLVLEVSVTNTGNVPGGSLPTTGSDVGGLVAICAMLALVGGGLLLLVRRRRS